MIAFIHAWHGTKHTIISNQLNPPPQKLHKQMSSKNASANTRRRSSTLKFNRPRSARTTMVSGFFQPARVRILVQSAACFAACLRFIYLLNITTRICYEGQVCSSVFFEPANVSIISACLLTVMFWKKMGMLFKKGVSKSTQNDEDVRFFQIFGFYTVFQFTMIVVTNTATALNVEVHALYNIQILVSGCYMIGLLYGCITFGVTLLHLMHFKSQDAATKEKTWKKVRKVVHMLAIVVPSGFVYVMGLMIYMFMGMRSNPMLWMGSQFLFRFLECCVIWGLTSCLKGRPPQKGMGQSASRLGSKLSTKLSTGIEIITKKAGGKTKKENPVAEDSLNKEGIGSSTTSSSGSKHIDVIHEEDATEKGDFV
jgi:hypothetical protein